jgi:lysozyme
VIQDLSNHPAITGEWRGAAYGNSFSTAAGRYQIIRATWADAQHVLSLPDFTAPSQDDAAVWLIKGKGALDLINMGQVEQAIARCSGIWASLPGSTSGQPQAKLADLMDVYMNNGGAVA